MDPSCPCPGLSCPICTEIQKLLQGGTLSKLGYLNAHQYKHLVNVVSFINQYPNKRPVPSTFLYAYREEVTGSVAVLKRNWSLSVVGPSVVPAGAHYVLIRTPKAYDQGEPCHVLPILPNHSILTSILRFLPKLYPLLHGKKLFHFQWSAGLYLPGTVIELTHKNNDENMNLQRGSILECVPHPQISAALAAAAFHTENSSEKEALRKALGWSLMSGAKMQLSKENFKENTHNLVQNFVATYSKVYPELGHQLVTYRDTFRSALSLLLNHHKSVFPNDTSQKSDATSPPPPYDPIHDFLLLYARTHTEKESNWPMCFSVPILLFRNTEEERELQQCLEGDVQEFQKLKEKKFDYAILLLALGHLRHKKERTRGVHSWAPWRLRFAFHVDRHDGPKLYQDASTHLKSIGAAVFPKRTTEPVASIQRVGLARLCYGDVFRGSFDTIYRKLYAGVCTDGYYVEIGISPNQDSTSKGTSGVRRQMAEIILNAAGICPGETTVNPDYIQYHILRKAGNGGKEILAHVAELNFQPKEGGLKCERELSLAQKFCDVFSSSVNVSPGACDSGSTRTKIGILIANVRQKAGTRPKPLQTSLYRLQRMCALRGIYVVEMHYPLNSVPNYLVMVTKMLARFKSSPPIGAEFSDDVRMLTWPEVSSLLYTNDDKWVRDLFTPGTPAVIIDEQADVEMRSALFQRLYVQALAMVERQSHVVYTDKRYSNTHRRALGTSTLGNISAGPGIGLADRILDDGRESPQDDYENGDDVSEEDGTTPRKRLRLEEEEEDGGIEH